MNRAAEWAIGHPIVAGIGGVLLLALLLTQCGGREGRPAPSPVAPTVSASPSGSATPIATTSATATATVGPTEVPSPTPDVNAEQVATRFVQAWLLPTGTHAQWLAGMKPYAAADLLKGYANPRVRADIPPAHTAGQPDAIVDGPALFLYRIKLDNGQAVQVEVSSDGATTVVTNIFPESH